MNRLEFYSNLNKYKDKKSLEHSADYKYYNKIDLPNGTTRYFYTKAEWDAYQDGLGRTKYEQQKKTIANNKAADEAKAKENQDNSTVVKNEAEKKKKQQEETIRKNAEAERAINLKKQNDSTIAKQRYENNKAADEAKDIENKNKEFAKKKENNPQMLNKNGDWRDDKGQDDMGWVMFDERNSNVPNYLSRLARGASISESFQKEFDNYIDSRYNKKEAKQFRELFQDVLKDQDNIKDQIIKDPNFTDAIDKLKNKEGRITESDSEEIEKLVRALYKRYSQKSKYKDYYWQDSQYFASGGMLMGYLSDGVWNKIVDEMKNTVLKDRNYKK